MAVAAAIAQVAGGVVGAFGSMEAGDQAFSAAREDAFQAERNAQLEIYSSQEDARRSRMHSAIEMGNARANIGASGVNAAESSILDNLSQAAREAELDALTIEYQGSLKAYDYRFQAKQDRARGQAAWENSRWSALSSLLGGASGAASTYSRAGDSKEKPKGPKVKQGKSGPVTDYG